MAFEKVLYRMNLQNRFIHKSWSIGTTAAAPASLLAGQPPAIRWLLHPRGNRWWADPFILAHEGKTYILCEEMDVRRDRGHIVSLDLAQESPEPTIALQLPYHLSYPFVLTHEGNSYVIPEMYQARKVTLFQPRGRPPRLEPIAVLIDDVAAIDPTVLHYNGSWWLFFTDADTDDNGDLHLWFADELLGPWQRHPACPVKRDRASSRPAGTPFMLDGELYRPGQDCSREYGAAVVLNRILTLDRTNFAEEPVARIEPDPHGPCPKGLHTLTVGALLSAVDGKADRFSVEPLCVLKRAFSKFMQAIPTSLARPQIPRP
jgi:hypothetical protein